MIKKMDLLRPAAHMLLEGIIAIATVDSHIKIVIAAAVITITVCCGTFPI
jgi:hypothetical protein